MPDVNYLIDSYLKARYEEDEEEEDDNYDDMTEEPDVKTDEYYELKNHERLNDD